jgi:hypothetical protein
MDQRVEASIQVNRLVVLLRGAGGFELLFDARQTTQHGGRHPCRRAPDQRGFQGITTS